MGVLNSMFSAFLMYSRIPVPKVEWNEENRRYALCFFPLVGAVTGILLLLWEKLCICLEIGSALFAAAASLLPLLVTGGIHADGFCDVLDARASWADREKKLEIMSDPHIGSFALIGESAYLLLQFGLFTELRHSGGMLAVALGYPMSRALSGLAAVTFRCAKKKGSLQDFSEAAHKRITIGVLTAAAAVCAVLMIAGSPVCGTAAVVAAMLSFWYYRHFSYCVFGGITGDLAGYFVQICELTMLLFVVAAGLLSGGAE